LLSFVINSVDAAKFAAVSRSIERATAGVPHEIVGVHDARSMCDGDRRGLARSTGDPVVFCHDDIELLMDDLPARLARHFGRFDVFMALETQDVVRGALVVGVEPDANSFASRGAKGSAGR
jgi:hypothetical protein